MLKISLVNNFISTSITHEVYAVKTLSCPVVRANEKKIELFEKK